MHSKLRIVLLLLLAAVIFVIPHTRHSKLNLKTDTSIIRLHSPSGAFFCSGTVIDVSHILTAAHCINGAPLLEPVIEVRGSDGAPTHNMAMVVSYNARMDTAMLMGNFEKLQHKDLIEDPAEIEAIFMDPSSDIVACGYPLGGNLVCTPVKDVHHELFWYAAHGFLYPGMSGGPVIDLNTGKIIAINQAVNADEIILTPLVSYHIDLGVNAEIIKQFFGK